MLYPFAAVTARRPRAAACWCGLGRDPAAVGFGGTARLARTAACR
jgi:hypothetical protein